MVQLTVPEAVEATVPLDEVLQTPVTPVSPAALASLHNLIKQDANALDERSKYRLQKHVQKLASAAQISFAKCALLQDQNQFLFNINNEAKVRRSTNRAILGTAKLMSYEDLEEARSKRAAKEKATKGKAKRCRKRKSPAPEPETKVTRMNKVPAPWRAPVARMY